MKDSKYIKAAGQLSNRDFVAIRQRLSPEIVGELKEAFLRCSEAAAQLDFLKKKIMYGRGLQNTSSEYLEKVSDSQIMMLHATLGLVTEAGEIIDCISPMLNEGTVDQVNLKEELGDMFWYMAEGASSIGESFENIKQVNIDKLQKRYKKKFSEKAANERDLNGERAILENTYQGGNFFNTILNKIKSKFL